MGAFYSIMNLKDNLIKKHIKLLISICGFK